jgi:hypothetical protein
VGSEKKICDVFSPILLSLYSKYVTKKAFERFGHFKVVRQLFRVVKYADDLVLLAKE